MVEHGVCPGWTSCNRRRVSRGHLAEPSVQPPPPGEPLRVQGRLGTLGGHCSLPQAVGGVLTVYVRGSLQTELRGEAMDEDEDEDAPSKLQPPQDGEAVCGWGSL